MEAKLMKRSQAVLVACALGILAGTGQARAQELEVRGPLAGAPAVIGMRVYREMRFQLQLQASMTLQDEYSRTVLFGGQAMFHPTDWLGIGIWGGFGAIHVDTALTDEVTSKGQTNEVNVLSLPRASAFPDQIANIQWIAVPQVTFIPLRGKLGLFEALFVDTDFYVLGGVGLVGLEERADVDQGTYTACRNMIEMGGLGAAIACLDDTQQERATRMAIAPAFGVGLSMYMADWVALTIEWRALPFAWNTSGTDESGDARGDFPDGVVDSQDRLSHFNHLMSLGFAFYLPTEPKLSHMDEK
jgi:outer membrane beta-barrel protein